MRSHLRGSSCKISLGRLNLLGLKVTAGLRAHGGYSLCSGTIPVVLGIQGKAISSPDS